MLKNGGDPNFLDDSNRTYLYFAAKNWNFELIKLLTENGADVSAQDAWQRTPLLHLAIENGCLDSVKLLLAKGADIEATEASDLKRPLHYAASSNYREILKVLLGMNIDVNAQDEYHCTPLFHAAKHQKLENVKLLLEHGARLSTETKIDKLLWQLAADSTSEILKLILRYHPNLRFEKKKVRDMECFKNIQFLIECGLDVDDEVAYDGIIATPLIHAMKRSRAMIMDLLNAGADVNRKSVYVIFRNSCGGGAAPRRDILSKISPVNPLYAVFCFQEFYGRYDLESSETLVTLLLQHGADVNIFPKSFADIFFSRQYGLSYFFCEFLRHIALMRDQQKLRVDERILSKINEEMELREFYTKCEGEIEMLKTANFFETSSSFFDVLAKNSRQLAAFARNTKVMDGFKAKDEYEAKFPIYGTAITLKLEMGLKRKELLEGALECCYMLLFPCLPRSCCDEIFSYLTNRNVGVLIDICQAANRE